MSDPADPEIQTFIQLVGELDAGALVFHLNQRMTELLDAVKQTMKPGQLTLQIKVGFVAGDVARFEFDPKVDTKIPDFDRQVTVMYRTAAGTLSKRDPRQGRLPLSMGARRKKTASGEAVDNEGVISDE